MTTIQQSKMKMNGEAFLDRDVCETMENYLESKGSLDGMFVLKPKKEMSCQIKSKQFQNYML